MELELIRPTQFTVGLREIRIKEAKLRAMTEAERKAYLKGHPVDGVLGPGHEFFAVDGHHFALAAMNIGIIEVEIEIFKDHSRLPPAEFWGRMTTNGHVLLYALGRGPLPPETLPRKLREMTDDPYRSLASAVKRLGGFKKTKESFAEFKWADFFRKQIYFKDGEEELEKAIKPAYLLAKTPLASHLPGYSPDDG